MPQRKSDHINAELDKADLVIAVGYDLVEYAPTHWNKKGGKTIVHIDFLAAKIDEDYPVDVEIVSDISRCAMAGQRGAERPLRRRPAAVRHRPAGRAA